VSYVKIKVFFASLFVHSHKVFMMLSAGFI